MKKKVVKKENISKDIIAAVKYVNEAFPLCIFAGSFGLVLRGILNRKVKDLDVLTGKEHSRHVAAVVVDGYSSSDIFKIAGKEVHCVPIKYKGIKIDLFAKAGYQDVVTFDFIDFHGEKIRVESSKGAIEAKREYIKDPKRIDVLKHKKDLKYIDAYRDIDKDDIPY